MSRDERPAPESIQIVGRAAEFLGTDRFEIRQRLGAGSMGVVYRAWDRERQVEVALKTLTRVDAVSIYRFKREFRSLADVVHPNLVTLYDLFADGDLWFFTMEFIVGQDFLAYVHGGAHRSLAPTPRPTPTPDATPGFPTDRPGPQVQGLEMLFPTPLVREDELRKVLPQVVHGLSAVHAAGKLHRDLKPDNVLVTRDGRAVVLDFGIVTERVTSGHSTLEPDVMGTPAYMAPEQAAGQIVDEASDWYALGAMLYEALSGTLPFDGTYLQIMHQKQVEDPVPPSQVVYGVPDDLDALCMQLLQRDPGRRPSGRALTRALKEHRPASVRPGGHGSIPPPEEVHFVGRAAQLEALRSALARTDRGRPVLALVRGPSGIGKTTLVQEFVRELNENREVVILRGRCYERERVPFKAFDSLIDSLSRYLKRLPAVEAGETLPREIFALAQLFPVLGRVDVVVQARRREAVPQDPDEQRRRGFAALKEMFRRIADRARLVVFIDDLQWGDVDSANLIGELVRGDDAPAFLCILTSRIAQGESDPCHDALSAHLQADDVGEVVDLPLGTLSHEETMELARLLLGAEHGVAAQSIGLEAGGSPHLVAELVSHVRKRHEAGTASATTRQGMVTFERALMQRVEELSPGARTLLDLVSVAARPVPEEVLALLGSFVGDVQAALVELRGAKLIRGVGTHDKRAIETYHDRIREVVVSTLALQDLRAWHRRIAAALEATGTGDLGAVTEHLLGARDFRRAHVYAIRAASQAAQALAFEKAARLFAIAVEHDPGASAGSELLVRWADALAAAGHTRQAAQAYFGAAAQAPKDQVAALRRRAGLQLLAGGYREEALQMLADGLGPLASELTVSEAEETAALAALYERLAGPAPLADAGTRAAAPEALAHLDVLWALGLGLALDGFARPRAVLARYTREALEAGTRAHAVRGLAVLHCMLVRGPNASASELGELAEALGRPVDDPRAQAWLCLVRGYDAWCAGTPRVAAEEIERAEELFRTRCAGAASEMRLARVWLAYLALTSGPIERVATCLEWAREAEQHEDALATTRLRLLGVPGALARDEADRAANEIAQSVAGWGREEHDVVAVLEVLMRAQLDLYRGDASACYGGVYRCEDLLPPALAAIPPVRAHLLLVRARLAVAAALETSGFEALLSRAEQDVREVAALGLPCFAHHARLLRAAIAAARRDSDTALAMLRAVQSDPAEDAPDSAMTTACARLCQSTLGGTQQGDGDALVEQAELALKQAGIADPRRFTRLYAPGFAR